jgi:hypothetical protein
MERGGRIRPPQDLSGVPTGASFLAISAAERIVPGTCSYSILYRVLPKSALQLQREAVEDPYFRAVLDGHGNRAIPPNRAGVYTHNAFSIDL